MAKRIKAPAQAVPQTLVEAETLAASLAIQMRAVERIESKLADEVTKLKVAAKEKTAPIGAEIKAKFNALAAFAAANRTDILPADRKSIAIAAGIIGWRLGNPAVEIATDEEAIIDWLSANGGERFLAEKVSLDRQAILADRDFAAKIPGLSIEQLESFFFKPLDIEVEQVQKLGKVPAQQDAA